MIKKLNKYILFSLLIFAVNGCTSIKEPDMYSINGYCIVNTTKQKQIGLNRFKTIEEFRKKCNSKMIFEFEKDECRLFTMKEMNFNIYIKDKNLDREFKIGEEKFMCGKKVIEYIK